MHEFSIAMSIVSIVEEHAKELNAKVVHEIELELGELSGIDPDALVFAMQLTEKDELTKKAKLVINKIKAKTRCNECNQEFEIINLYSACPKCNSYDHSIFQGRELKVKTIVVD